jgi:hypothetical protein
MEQTRVGLHDERKSRISHPTKPDRSTRLNSNWILCLHVQITATHLERLSLCLYLSLFVICSCLGLVVARGTLKLEDEQRRRVWSGLVCDLI